MRKLFRVFVLIILAATGGATDLAAQEPPALTIYLFWERGCPHCSRAQDFLQRLVAEDPRLSLSSMEISDPEHQELFIAVNRALAIEAPAVPTIIIGERAFIGYRDDTTTGAAFRARAEACLVEICPDILRDKLIPTAFDDRVSIKPEHMDRTPALPRVIHVPLIGPISTQDLSLPVLTVLLAALDGFNPCAMWALVFLIGLLLGMENRLRMWALGIAFLAASGVVYFLFLAAWLNALLFLGAVFWIRLAVAGVAIAGGIFNLRAYVLKADDVCRITAPAGRRRIFDWLKKVTQESRFTLALIGIVALSFAVNLVELLCSAGIPAVYTQVLVMNPLPTWQYYGYLMLYIAVFLLDDVIVFALAMITLQVSGFTGKYTRVSHLIGGTVLIIIGGLLLLRPELLTFA